MANGSGGVIVIGLRDENDVAVELTPVQLADGEEARIRQIAALNITPHLTFDIRVVESASDRSSGYYLLIVPFRAPCGPMRCGRTATSGSRGATGPRHAG